MLVLFYIFMQSWRKPVTHISREKLSLDDIVVSHLGSSALEAGHFSRDGLLWKVVGFIGLKNKQKNPKTFLSAVTL